MKVCFWKDLGQRRDDVVLSEVQIMLDPGSENMDFPGFCMEAIDFTHYTRTV